MCPRSGEEKKRRQFQAIVAVEKGLSEKKVMCPRSSEEKREEDSKPSLSSKKGFIREKIAYFFPEKESLG